jgi:archaellum component FlaC
MFKNSLYLKAKNMQICKERIATLYIAYGEYSPKLKFFLQILIFLVNICILSFVVYLQEAQTQEPEIISLENRLRGIETQIVSTDTQLRQINERLNSVTNEINRLKEEESSSKGFFSSITGIFRRGKLGKLYTESQTLADDIKDLNKKRDPLVNQLITLSDKLIDRTNTRMGELMASVRKSNQNSDFITRDEAWKQLSYLWQLAEKVTEIKNKYVPRTPGSERQITSPSLLSHDPEELRLGAAIWRDEAITARAYAARINEQISTLRKKKSVLEQAMEVSKEMQRRDEERGAIGVGTGTTNITWGSDVANKKKIREIDEEINRLQAQKKEFESKAERFEGQSKILERRADQIDENP